MLAQVAEDAELPDSVRTRIRANLASLPAAGVLPQDPDHLEVDTVVPTGSGGFTVPARELTQTGQGKESSLGSGVKSGARIDKADQSTPGQRTWRGCSSSAAVQAGARVRAPAGPR